MSLLEYIRFFYDYYYRYYALISTVRCKPGTTSISYSYIIIICVCLYYVLVPPDDAVKAVYEAYQY